MKKKLFTFFAVGLFAVSSTIILSSFVSDEEDGSGNPLFEQEHPITVHCSEVSWTRTTYYDEYGKVVGETYVENGVIKTEYKGSYVSSTVSSGTVAAHDATAIECYGWGWGCHRVTAVDACQ